MASELAAFLLGINAMEQLKKKYGANGRSDLLAHGAKSVGKLLAPEIVRKLLGDMRDGKTGLSLCGNPFLQYQQSSVLMYLQIQWALWRKAKELIYRQILRQMESF